MSGSVPWKVRLAEGTEAIQAEVVDWYRRTRAGRAYVPTMIWGTLQTEAYARVILGQVVAFLDVPDDVPAGVAQRMRRQEVLYDGVHHYDVVLGEQALYTNIGGPEVMRPQIERLLRERDLASLRLGILASAVPLELFPPHAFHLYGGEEGEGDGHRAHVELVSSSLDVTDPGELELYEKAFATLSRAASYGDAARELLEKAHSFWSDAARR